MADLLKPVVDKLGPRLSLERYGTPVPENAKKFTYSVDGYVIAATYVVSKTFNKTAKFLLRITISKSDLSWLEQMEFTPGLFPEPDKKKEVVYQ